MVRHRFLWYRYPGGVIRFARHRGDSAALAAAGVGVVAAPRHRFGQVVGDQVLGRSASPALAAVTSVAVMISLSGSAARWPL